MQESIQINKQLIRRIMRWNNLAPHVPISWDFLSRIRYDSICFLLSRILLVPLVYIGEQRTLLCCGCEFVPGSATSHVYSTRRGVQVLYESIGLEMADMISRTLSVFNFLEAVMFAEPNVCRPLRDLLSFAERRSSASLWIIFRS